MTARRPAVPFLLLAVVSIALFTPHAAQSQEEDVFGWPREMPTAKGLVVMYQPQLEDFDGRLLKSRAAVSVALPDQEQPVFGTVWMEATVDTDRDTRLVHILALEVPTVRFPEATEAQQDELAAFLEQEIPSWEVSMSLDRLVAMLEFTENRRRAVTGLNDDPPIILFVDYPAVLVTIDGEPQLRTIENTSFEFVVNTAFNIVHDPSTRSFYLYGGSDTWYKSADVMGPWALADTVPRDIVSLIPDEEPGETEDSVQEDSSSGPPELIIAVEPTELIVTEGRPSYSPLGTDLLYISNTESDVLFELESQQHFLLLSGRWFAGSGFDGPWTNVPSDELPASFSAIPKDSEMAHLLTWVAGTQEAEEAILDAQIPETTAIKRDSTVEVTYDGKPQWEDIEDTELQYAANTAKQVIKYGDRYFCADEGVWYTAQAPEGPWTVATEVPAEIYKQPATSPTFNTTYVHVYDATPTVVYVGYYPGYMWSFPHHGCLVFGTGWWYRPWWGPVHYFPRHSTWGFHVRWNPWYGWGFGFSYSTGRFTFGIGFGGWGGWRMGGWWGPVGWRPYARGFNRGWHHGARAGFRAGYRAGARHGNLYRQPRNAARNASMPRARPATRQPITAQQRPNNVYADRNGNVHRRTQDGSWQSRENGNWSPTRPTDSSAQTRDRASTIQTRPSTGDRASSVQTRPSTGARDLNRSAPSSLNRDFQARQRGTTRSQSFQRSAGRQAAPRGGGRRR